MIAISPQKASAARQLHREISGLQPSGCGQEGKIVCTGLGLIERAFPKNTFPTAAVHEFISTDSTAGSATTGFISGLLRAFMQAMPGGQCLWISKRRIIYPPALAAYGIAPERIVFVRFATDRDVLWAAEEALKCEGLAAVVGEVGELSFTASRRLQLAVESSRVTGFIHRCYPRRETEANACVTRWRITPLPSATTDNLPGVGHPRWRVHLQKVRAGRPGVWQLEWTREGFRHVPFLTASVAAAVEGLPQKQKVA